MADVVGSAIKVEIDLNEMLPERYLGSDEEGPRYGPVSLYDAIIGAATDRLVGVGEKVLRERVEVEMREAVMREVDARLPAIIEEAFAAEVETGDGFASRKVSIRELIGRRVKEQCATGRGSFNSTVLDESIRKEVDSGLQAAFREEVEAARAAIKKRMTAKAAELLAAESLREVGIR
jgi:hypothetical protein